ncbi:WapI family immunity protein [Chromobacterium violaceum]|uniref:WapI family immunity protein n=1 Tax=Chromobacterium violaceum TaxID=536 RepID=UPI003CC82F56
MPSRRSRLSLKVSTHMSVMRFENSGSHFEMSIAIEDDPATQNRGDVYITIDVLSGGFRGHNDLWVFDGEFSAFCAALISLEHSLNGEATLESMSPDGLKLRIFSVNSRGHLAVEGNTGYWSQDQEGSFWHSLSFGFSFEPQQLTRALTARWIRGEG